jgi:rubrerythrin
MWYKETLESILKKAVSKEKDAYLIYTNAANGTKNTYVKTVLNNLAKKELKHIQTIEDFDIKKLKWQEVAIDEKSHEWISEYLTCTDEAPGKDIEFKDLFAYVAKREKKSYEFYTAMSNFIDDSELKKLFAWLAQEEKKHESDLVWDFMYR